MVAPVGAAAVAAGVDGLIVEVHANPEEALSDGTQSLLPGNFKSFMKGVTSVAKAVGRTI